MKLSIFISDSFFLFIIQKNLCQLNKPHARVCADYYCGKTIYALTTCNNITNNNNRVTINELSLFYAVPENPAYLPTRRRKLKTNNLNQD